MHCVFSTSERRPWLTPAIRERLWPYLGGIARENDMKALAIGGEWFRPELPLLEHIAIVRKTMSNLVPENDDLPPRMNRLEFSRLVRDARGRAA